MAFIVFSHGLDNKPEAGYLFDLWKRKLSHDEGLDIDGCGVESQMNYWADVLYPSPDTNLAAYESATVDVALDDSPDLRRMPHKDDARIRGLAATLGVDPDTVEDSQPTQSELEAVQYERVPVPDWLRKRIMARFVRDAHHYFFNQEFSPRPDQTFRVRDELRARFIKCLQAGANNRPLVVVSHSMGTIIAYDCLKNEPDCPAVDGLMTIGSPLGIDDVQMFFDGWSKANSFPSSKLNGPWVNVYDRLDIVCGADPLIANDYMRDGKIVVEDLEQKNWGTWRHSISKYLQGGNLRGRLKGLLGLP